MENNTQAAESKQLIINEAQLILAEKRTSLAGLRTGLALLGLPLAVVSFLIAMSKHYHASQVWAYLMPVLAVCAGLGILGVYLCWRSVRNLHRADVHLAELKKQSSLVGANLD